MSADRLPTQSPLHTTAWMLTATLLLARLLPAALQPGMFFDGVTHATIARNMAAGEGRFLASGVVRPGCDYHEAADARVLAGVAAVSRAGRSFLGRKALFGDAGHRHGGDHRGDVAAVACAIGRSCAIARGCRLRSGRACRAWAWMYDSNMLENTLGLFALGERLRIAAGREFAAGLARPGRRLAAICLVGAVLSKGPGRHVSADNAAGDRA